jgi:hypothetical protein
MDGAVTGTDPDTGLPYLDLSPEPPPHATVHKGHMRHGQETPDELELKLARYQYGRGQGGQLTGANGHER